MTTTKNMEQRLRRKLKKMGYMLCKSRTGISLDNFGQYMVVDAYTNGVLLGERFDWTLDDIAEWLAEDE